MGAISYYRVPLSAVDDWYNICGYELEKENIEDKIMDDGRCKYVETSLLDEISPLYFQAPLLESTVPINDCIQSFIWKQCQYNDEEVKAAYHEAFFGILRATTSINVLPDNHLDYALYYRRVEALILATLLELDAMSIEETISLYQLIKGKKFKKLLDLRTKYYCISLLASLSIVDDINSRDYMIFADDSDQILYKNLVDIIVKKMGLIHMGELDIEKEDNALRLRFRRLTAKDTFKMIKGEN